MIIIEGPNGAGKSVLAEKLARDLSFSLHKFTKKPETFDDFNGQVTESCALLRKEVIQDRCPMISDWVYSTHNMDRASFITPLAIKEIFTRVPNILVYCESLNLKPKKPIDEKTEKLIRFAYFDTFRFLQIPYVAYDYEYTKYDDFLKALPFEQKTETIMRSR